MNNRETDRDVGRGSSLDCTGRPVVECFCVYECKCMRLCPGLSRSHHRGRSAVHLLLQLHHLLHVLGLRGDGRESNSQAQLKVTLNVLEV